MTFSALLTRFLSRSPRTAARRAARRLSVETLEDRTVPSTIQGTVFHDFNSNGVMDAGETPLSGWTVFLDQNRNSVADRGEPTAVTDANGQYFMDTTAYPPAPSGPGSLDYPTLVLQVGTGGRWLNTTATFGAVKRVNEPDAVRNFGVRFQPFVGVAPVGAETLVNATTAGQQGGVSATAGGEPVSVAADANGNYVVAWRTFTAGTDTISARVFNADGTARTGELTVGTAPDQGTYYQQMPQVAMAADGRFAVTWTAWTGSYTAGTNPTSTYMRVYLGDGTPVTSAVAVFTGSSNASGSLQGIAMDDAGDFAVMYGKSTYSKGKGWTTAAMTIQRYTKAGAANGNTINAGTPNLINGHQGIAMDANGNFVIVWDDGSIYAQRYTAGGKKTGSQITVASSSDIIWQSSVGMAHDGRFMVGWEHRVMQHNPDGSVYYDFIGNAQAFTASGSRSGSVLEVTRSNAVEQPLAIAYDDAGNVTFSYSELRSPKLGTSYLYNAGEVRFRRLSAAGKFGPESIVNTTTQGAQFDPAIAATGNGTFVIAWQGNGAGDDAGIFAQRFAAGPQIGSFTSSAASVLSGDSVTLTAANITDGLSGATITEVDFYYFDGSGNLVTLGTGTQDSNGAWSLAVTISLSPGSYTLYAQVQDSGGVFSDPLALTLQVL